MHAMCQFFCLNLQTLIFIETKMKKMKFAVVFAALVSVFGFTSCLDSDDNGGSNSLYTLATVRESMVGTTFIPDCSPNLTLIPKNLDLTQVGISMDAKRVLLNYKISEGQEITAETKNVYIDVVAGAEFKPSYVSNRPDTLADFSSSFYQFERVSPMGYDYIPFFSYPRLYAEHDFVSLGYTYRANKVGKVGLMVNRVSNDTLYLDLKGKFEGSGNTGYMCHTYDLSQCGEYVSMRPSVDDSIRITVRALVSEYVNTPVLDSLTTAIKKY